MDTVKVGVIGVGHLGKEHARVYAETTGVELVGVVDADLKQARTIGKKHRAEYSDRIDLLFDRVQAVSVVVPTVHHCAVSMPFLERGVSVLVEKPMSFSVQEAERMVAAAARTGARLQVGHIERFNPGIRAIAGMGLQPLFIEAHRLSPFPFRSADVGVVFDLMIHDIDIVMTLMPRRIARIDAIGVPVISAHEDIANVRLTFDNGAVANLTASRISLKRMRKIRIFGPNSYTTIDTGERKAIVYTKKPGFSEVARKLRGKSAMQAILQMRALDYQNLVSVNNIHLDNKEPLKAELESFVNCVRNRTAPEVPGEDGVAAVRVAEEIVKQIREKVSGSGIEFPV